MDILLLFFSLILSVGCLPQKPEDFYYVGENVDNDKNVEDHHREKHQSGFELLNTFILPALLFSWREDDPLQSVELLEPAPKPIFNSLAPFSGADQFAQELEDFVTKDLSRPVQHSGRAAQCTSGATKTTAITSRMGNQGHFRFVSETTSSAPGGDDPRRPPTPPTKPTPQPRLNLKRKKNQNPVQNRPFIRNPYQQRPDQEVEVILLDEIEGEVVIPNLSYSHNDISDEVSVQARPGATSVVTWTNVCPSTSSAAAKPAQEVFLILDSNSEASNGPDDVQFTTRLPALRPYPGTDRYPPGSNEPILPYWKGTMWGRAGTGVTNTCVMDPFFSHVMYIARRHPRYFRLHLNLANNGVERFILALSLNTNTRHSISEVSKGLHTGWIRTIGQSYFPTKNGDVDMASSQFEAVFTHILDATRIWFVFQCDCETTSRTQLLKERLQFGEL